MSIPAILQFQHIISIRDFVRSIAKITDQPDSKMYTIVKNGKEVGMYVPKQYKEEMLEGWQYQPKKYHSLFANYDKIAGYTGDPTLSQTMDKLLYDEV